jgi:hypothetical protein
MASQARLLLGALVVGCSGGGSGPAPQSCQIELLAHFAPLPPSAATRDRGIQYTEVAARDGVAYLGTWHGEGVLVLDVASGAELARLDDGGGPINSVALRGTLLAVAPLGKGLVVYDVSDARHPARRAALQMPARNCHTVFIHEDIVYCSTATAAAPQLLMARVSSLDPAGALTLEAAGTYDAPVREDEGSVLVHDVFVDRREDRRLAYLAYWERGLQIVDVTDPGAPRLVGASPPTPQRWTHSVWVEGRYAYVGEESYRGPVRIYDVGDPTAPVEVGQLHSTEGDAISAHNVQVAGGYLYASWYQDGLRVFPAAGPTAIGEVAYFHTWSGLDNRDNPVPTDSKFAGDWDVFLDGDRIFASDTQTGLWVLRHRPATPACAPDRPRGPSAFATAARAPLGFSALAPDRVRPGRTIPLYAAVTSTDPYGGISDQAAADLHLSLTLSGAEPQGPAEALPGRERGSSRLLRRWARVADDASGTASLVAEMTDLGARRRMVREVTLLPPATPNQDVEPNEDLWIASVLDGPAIQVTGALAPQDHLDSYLLARPRGPLRIHLVGQGVSAPLAPNEDLLVLTVSRVLAGGPDLGPSERLGPAEMAVTIPAGDDGPLLVSVEGPTAQAVTYQLDLSPVP